MCEAYLPYASVRFDWEAWLSRGTQHHSSLRQTSMALPVRELLPTYSIQPTLMVNFLRQVTGRVSDSTEGPVVISYEELISTPLSLQQLIGKSYQLTFSRITLNLPTAAQRKRLAQIQTHWASSLSKIYPNLTHS